MGAFKRKHVMLIVLAFIVGALLGSFYNTAVGFNGHSVSSPLAGAQSPAEPAFSAGSANELPSPSDWVKEGQIEVTKSGVFIDIKDAAWATFTDTNSMDPVIDFGANAIEIVPRSEDDIHTGDIVSYKSAYAEGTIIHRVIGSGYDENGKYFVLKGDNNSGADPGKVRFSDIHGVVVAIVY